MISTSLDTITLLNQKIMEAFLLIVDRSGEIQINHILSLETISDKQLKVRGWFLPEVISSLSENTSLTLMVLNLHNCQSYQISGICKDIKSVAFLDGVAAIEEKFHSPQVEWELTIQINAVKELNKD